MKRISYALRALLFCLLSVALPVTTLASSTVSYIHTDATGNAVAATDSNGQLLWKESYYPYGDRIKHAGDTTNKVWFHGKPQDAATGLSYFGARYYDPVLGRFMAIDPVGVDERNLHSFNRYAYGNNNPYKYRDPDGRVAMLLAREFQISWRIGIAATTAFEVATGVTVGAVIWNKANGLPWNTVGLPAMNADGSSDENFGEQAAATGASAAPPPDDEDGFDDEPRKYGEKGKTFRGGKKAQRDNWYGQNDKDFQKWWHREGKSDFNGGRDIQDAQNAKDAMRYWRDIGRPVPK